jgi:hypothetical protein
MKRFSCEGSQFVSFLILLSSSLFPFKSPFALLPELFYLFSFLLSSSFLYLSLLYSSFLSLSILFLIIPSFPRLSFPRPSFPRHFFPRPSIPRHSFPRPSIPRHSFPRPSFTRPPVHHQSFPSSFLVISVLVFPSNLRFTLSSSILHILVLLYAYVCVYLAISGYENYQQICDSR